MRTQSWLLVVAVALFLVFGGLSLGVGLYFDLLWYQELGKSVVFTTILYAKSAVLSVTLLISFLFLYANLLLANRGPGTIQIGIPTPTGQITAYTFKPTLVARIAGLFSLVVA